MRTPVGTRHGVSFHAGNNKCPDGSPEIMRTIVWTRHDVSILTENDMTYNSQLHHRRSTRLKEYDYSQAGLYFITICCHNRECFFGEIKSVEAFHGMSKKISEKIATHPLMILNEPGKIADTYWLNIPNHFSHVVLHEHIVMPNHVHAIIELIDPAVGIRHGLPLHIPSNYNAFGKSVAGSISVILNQYKSSVKRWCNKNDHEYFQWQTRFYDHLINDDKSYHTIAEYIVNNPVQWSNDKFFTQKH